MFVAAEIPRDKAVASKSKGNRPSDGEKNPLPKSPPSISASNAPPPIENTCATKADKKEHREWGKFVIEVLTLLAVVYYACVASRQLTEMRRATDAARESFVVGQRPWIGIDGTPTARQESERWYIGFSVKNFGLSPALHAVLSSGAENVNKAGERYCTVGEKLTTSGEDSSGPSGEQGYVLFPGKIALLQTAAVPGNQQNIVYLVGCATYFDQFGKRPVHHTRFCYYVKTPLVADKPMFPCFAGWSAD